MKLNIKSLEIIWNWNIEVTTMEHFIAWSHKKSEILFVKENNPLLNSSSGLDWFNWFYIFDDDSFHVEKTYLYCHTNYRAIDSWYFNWHDFFNHGIVFEMLADCAVLLYFRIRKRYDRLWCLTLEFAFASHHKDCSLKYQSPANGNELTIKIKELPTICITQKYE